MMNIRHKFASIKTGLRFWKTSVSAVIVALGLFLGTIYALPSLSELWADTFVLKEGTVAAIGVTPNYDTFQGSILQKKAFENSRILPLYGSSEMSMIIDYHPAKILTPETGVTPFLIGRGGTQTLVQVLNIAALGDTVRNKKLAVFLTPQWYGRGGISEDTFAGNFSALHVYEILKDPTLSDHLKNDIAERLLQFTKPYQDFPYLKKMLVLQGKTDVRSRFLKLFYTVPAQMDYASLAFKDATTTHWWVNNIPKETVARYTNVSSVSTIEPQWDELQAQAIEKAKQTTDNNPFEMENGFYTKNILPNLEAQKNASKNAQYTSSPEYEDLQLLMAVLKEKGAQPLFVVLPMNGRWSDYTGIPVTERKACYQKLAQMIQREGFALANFSPHEKDDYYLRDPWHLAWKGWLEVDEKLYQFYRSK